MRRRIFHLKTTKTRLTFENTLYDYYNRITYRVYNTSYLGAYRKIVVKPKDLLVKVVDYSSNEESLILSEKETLDGFGGTTEEVKEGTTEEVREGTTEQVPEGTAENEEGKENSAIMNYKGVTVRFTLPSSAYATMLLRELLHYCDSRF